MGIDSKSDSQHLLDQDGQVREALPDVIDATGKLIRLVDFFVSRGYNVWPLPAKIAAHWQAPIRRGNSWLVGDTALRWRWHLFLMGRIREQFPDHFQSLVSGILLAKGGDSQGALVLIKPLRLLDVLAYLESEGFIRKGARA